MNYQDQNIKEMQEQISMLQAEIQNLIDRITKIETAAADK
jgi:prefoldin subunit 5